MNFTFQEKMVGRMLEQMRKERSDLAAFGPKTLRTSIMNSRRFTGAVVVAQVGYIAQREWNKWRMA